MEQDRRILAQASRIETESGAPNVSFGEIGERERELLEMENERMRRMQMVDDEFGAMRKEHMLRGTNTESGGLNRSFAEEVEREL
jgi:hypothetical protein